MRTTRVKLLTLTLGACWISASSMAAITATSDDFSTNTETYPNWISVGTTNTEFNYDGTTDGDYDDGDPASKLAYTPGMTLTGDGISDLDGSDGGLRLNTLDAVQGNEAIGLTLAGTLSESNTISFTGSVYNDNSSFCPFNAQLWNLTDNSLLAESGNITVDAIGHVAYTPKSFDVSYVVTAADEGDTLQIRFLENANSTARDIYVDNFSVTSTPPVPPDPGLQVLEWNFNSDADPIAEDNPNYDYTSDQTYVGSNAVANTLAFRGGSGGTDYLLKDKGTGHEKSLLFRTINPQGNDVGIYIQKMDFRQGGLNTTNQTKVSWSFDILGSDSAGDVVPSNWTVRVNYANYSPNINTSDAWFNTNNSVLAQTFDFVDDDATWTTVTGSYTIAIDDAGTFGGIQIRNPKGQGAYTSADGVYLDNIQITIQTIEPDLTGLFDDWAAGYSLTGTNATSTANPDGDALNNLYEYALGGNPTNANDTGYATMLNSGDDGGTNWFYYVHPENNTAAKSGLNYTLNSDENLVVAPGWTNAVYEVLGTAEDFYADGFNAVTNRISTEGKSQEFIKLQIDGL
ncbi:hypothetical protein P4B35_06680 [Pontiellaceae bacterium B12227]|nr:hypothetical protein [Pontiellaceae bacterium B12227]